MTGNIALDVSIGLVFTYLLYSLYATVLMEIISSSLGLRAKNLSYALRRMLMDEKQFNSPTKEFLSRVWTTIIQMWGKASNLKNAAIYNDFFNQPTIKYLNSGGVGRRPSYISSQMFVKAIIDTIKRDDPDISVLAGIEQGISDRRLALGDESSESLDHIESLLHDANGDIFKFRILLEDWYNETMSRASGWFKRTVQFVLFMIGVVIAISFNVDTIAIVKLLSKDPDAREQMVNVAISYADRNSSNPLLLKDIDKRDSIMQAMQYEKQLEFLEEVQGSLREEIRNSQNVLSSGWNINRVIPYYLIPQKSALKDGFVECSLRVKSKEASTDSMVYVTVHESVDTVLLQRMELTKLTGRRLELDTTSYKANYIFTHPGGYFLTVLALSLGAPFWFDLLNKLVKLRTSKAISSGDTSSDSSDTKSMSASNRDPLYRAG